MSPFVHRLYVAALFVFGFAVAAYVGVHGFAYFTTPQDTINNHGADLDARISDIDVEIELRSQGLGGMEGSDEQLLRDKDRLKAEAAYWKDWAPAGLVGHGLGVIGATMMSVGVALYSTRKRARRFRFLGKIRHWLELHIFLCLLGPALVLFHTTFKFGGIVAISAWSMIFVALSGLLGRYIYTQIPKTIEGNELTIEDLAAQDRAMADELRTAHGLGDEALARIDALNTVRGGGQGELRQLLLLLRDDLTRAARMRRLRADLAHMGVPAGHIHAVMSLARRRTLLERRIAFLDTARSIFHYWHVVHLPFAIIMFIILAIHIAVTVSLGYTWIF